MSSVLLTNKQIPGPDFLSFIRNVRENPVLYCYELMKKYGDVVRCRSIEDIYLISDPVMAKEVFMNSQKLFDKSNFINNRLKEVMGDGLVVTNGAKWKRQRKPVQVIYKKEELQKLRPEIERRVTEMITEWKTKADKKQSLNVSQYVRDMVMKIMAGCLFPIEDDAMLQRLKEDFFIGNAYVSDPMPFNLPGWMPMSRKSKLKRALNDIDHIILTMMAERADTNKYEGKLMASVMDQCDENGRNLSKPAMLAEIKNIFISSFFSTSDFLSWLIYSLAQYPEWASKIFEEMQSVGDDDLFDSFDTASNMQLFIHETLRFYPPAWASSHHTLHQLQLGDYLIPARTTVLVSIFNLHRHPAYWKNPDQFDPNRFERSKELPEKAMFVPFGLGPRKCVGMNLASMVINIVCAKVVKHFQLRVNDCVPAIIQSRVSLGSKNDLEIFIEPR